MDKLFDLKARKTTVSREIAGGITTFLAMSYILALNPDILSKSGLSWGSVFTATAVSACIGTLVMAFVANLPVALAPGLGLNAFFTYTVVLTMKCTPAFALTAVLLEGLLFILLSVFGIREAIIKSIPESLRKAVAVGIGLFVTLIGLVNAGIVVTPGSTPLAFVNFSPENPTALVAILGLVITIALYVLKIPGAILLGICITTVIGIPFGVTKIPESFKPISIPEAPALFHFEWGSVLTIKFFIVFFTFLFTDLFDTVGTLLGVTEQANLKDKNGNMINAKGALLADAVGTVAGACLGTSTVTSFVESSSGVAAGARTGLASVVTAFLFIVALFLSPLFALIPMAATAPALIFVGFLMMSSVSGIDFKDLSEGIPSFITIMAMPFSYSISKGISLGIISFVLCKIFARKIKDIPLVTWILAVIFLLDFVFEAVK
ncbi:NCS2 family permease [Treponema zioleckii]|uniref:NCS2 family permease n=1 Tax=Treponema zioleckii TaxID=331680 RepID=UPI00168BF599|nr:NCS2 family permease [Treponema zioleckii]